MEDALFWITIAMLGLAGWFILTAIHTVHKLKRTLDDLGQALKKAHDNGKVS